MDEQKNTEGRLALIGLTVLTVATLLLFSVLFLDAGSFFVGGNDDLESGKQTDHSTDNSTTNEQDLSVLIAEYQTRMNRFQTQLASPYLLAVGDDSPIPDDYSVELKNLTGENSSMKLEQTAASKMNEFLAAAEKAGYNVIVTAAYRTEKEQEKLYLNTVNSHMDAGYPEKTAHSMAAMEVGAVNHSEHQLGFAVDFKSTQMSVLGSDGRSFEEYLTSTIHKYGFVLSFPAGGETETGREPNTAHYRYVGVEAASIMAEKQWTLVEYRDYLQGQIDYLKQSIESLEKR